MAQKLYAIASSARSVGRGLSEPDQHEGDNQGSIPKFCRECGAKTPASTKFCEKCGTKLIEDESHRTPTLVAVGQKPPVSHKDRTLPTIKVVIIVLMLIISAIWAPLLARTVVKPVLVFDDVFLTHYYSGSTEGSVTFAIHGQGNITVESIEVSVDRAWVALTQVTCVCQHQGDWSGLPVSMRLPSDKIAVHVSGMGLARTSGGSVQLYVTGIWTFLGYSERIVLNSETQIQWVPV